MTTTPNFDTSTDYEAEAERLYREQTAQAQNESELVDIVAALMFETEDCDD
jgi:hypothetical protein